MTIKAIVNSDDGTILNIIVAGDDPLEAEAATVIVDDPDGQAQIGGTWYEAEGFTKPITSLPPLGPLSARQIRLVLNRHGYLAQVEPAIAAIPDETERNEALIEWTYASSFEPDHPLIASMRLALGISEADMETMWREAMAL
ncbi:hypothetical protein SAMN04515647_1688 [Cohaesibacter sp. ES.047]|uniref:hypothetical protein n=1 Tax=Cohaesibacter sp. ES.047 TaxID=1798205 RepID=UPI000BB8F0AF|nr:hypothetical protein [Cohaesibacter sp. ES.047]SNY91467.1 hypothetical protein SAMN04515647_1688 [Cohaesibacter sp. ES.047]